MPSFISRPNLPTSLANKLVQLAAMQADPIAAGIKSAAGAVGKGIEKKKAKEEQAKAKEEQARIKTEEKKLKAQKKDEDKLLDLQRRQQDILLEQQRRGGQLPGGAPAPAQGSLPPGAEGPQLPPQGFLPPGAESPPLPPGQLPPPDPGMFQALMQPMQPAQSQQDILNLIQSLGPLPQKTATPIQEQRLKLRKSAEERKADESMARIKATEALTESRKASAAKARRTGRGKAEGLKQMLTEHARVEKQISTLAPGASPETLRTRRSELRKAIDKTGFPGYDKDFSLDFSQAQQAIIEGKITREEAIKRLKKRYPSFDESTMKDEETASGWLDSIKKLFGG